MKSLKHKLSAIVLSTMFISIPAFSADTGLGIGNGGAVINNTQGGFAGMNTGAGYADLNFNGNTHVNWDSLNINKGETLNFNAVNGANNLTILNTVNANMSKIYGDINANNGISKLIIANPNGVLFDGTNFTAAGDVLITTHNMANLNIKDLDNAKFTELYKDGKLIPVYINNSTFNVGGEYSVVAAGIDAAT